MRYAEATAADLFDRSAYVETVLANRDRPVGDANEAHKHDTFHQADHNEDSYPQKDKQSEESH